MGADYELWKGIIRGERSSFAIIFKTYYEILYQYALRFTHDEDKAKDFIQELFIRIWRNRDNLSEVEFVKPYLIKSLRRIIHRELKKHNPEETFDEHLLSEVDKKFFYNFQLSTVEDDFRTEKLKELLSELSFQQKEVLYLRYYNDLDFKEIAQIMSLSYQSVRNYAHQAIARLRKYLLVKNN